MSNNENSLSQDQYTIGHLKNRIGHIVADYETKLADGALRITVLSQGMQELQQQMETSQARIVELEEELKSFQDDNPAEKSDGSDEPDTDDPSLRVVEQDEE